MFLKELNKDESVAFVNLVSQFANIDNEFAKEEKEVIKEYLKELSLDKDDVEELSLEAILEILKLSTDRVKRIIYFELIGLALVDGEYEEHEVDFLDNISKELNISRAEKISIANFYYDFTDTDNLTVTQARDKVKLLKDEAEKIINSAI